MAKALEQITQTFTAALSGMTTQITSVKELAMGTEKFRQGGVDQNTEHRLNSGLFTAIVAVGVTIVVALVATGVTLYIGLHK